MKPGTISHKKNNKSVYLYLNSKLFIKADVIKNVDL